MRQLLTLAFLLFAMPVWADIHWVSPTGTQTTWGSCQSASVPALTPTSNYCNRTTANNAAAGDTVIFRGGTYTVASGTGIAPSNNGSAGSYITFQAYYGETPNLVATGSSQYWINFSGKSYIKIDGLTFTDFWAGNIGSQSDHIEIANCTFTATYPANRYWLKDGGNSQTHDVWLHHNSFSNSLDDTSPCAELVNNLTVGNGSEDTQEGSLVPQYWTIENNAIFHSGHGGIESFGRYVVIKQNVLHNEPWRPSSGSGCNWPNTADVYDNDAYAGYYGHRNIQLHGHGWPDGITYTVFEGNRSGHAGTNPANDGANSFDLNSARNIVRYNFFYAAMNNGLLFKTDSDSTTSDNRVYNNTFYHNGYGYTGTSPGTGFPTGYDSLTGIAIYPLVESGNVIKNNLLYDNHNSSGTYRDIQKRVNGDPTTVATVTNNWCTSSNAYGCAVGGNPTFVDTTVTDPMSLTLPDLRLQASSGAINPTASLMALTTASPAQTNSTTLVVADAMYFQDGTWGADMARGVTLFPDWVAVGTVSNVAAISAINYSTNTITLATQLTWDNNASVWLYKKSDGVIVLRGTAPDYGAAEYGSATPAAPTGVTIVAGSPPEIQWTHDNANATWFELSVDGTAYKSVGNPSSHQTPLPVLANGVHTIVVRACGEAGCGTAATSITVVKL